MIADGNIVAFENGLGNEINGLDAVKIMNAGENLGISRNGHYAICRSQGRSDE
jgi:hypothetical protein